MSPLFSKEGLGEIHNVILSEAKNLWDEYTPRFFVAFGSSE